MDINAFMETNKTVVGIEVIIYSVKSFKIHINVTKMKPGGVISHKWEAYCLIITLFNPQLINYTTIEKKNVTYNSVA